jgi:hypothetical protein
MAFAHKRIPRQREPRYSTQPFAPAAASELNWERKSFSLSPSSEHIYIALSPSCTLATRGPRKPKKLCITFDCCCSKKPSSQGINERCVIILQWASSRVLPRGIWRSEKKERWTQQHVSVGFIDSVCVVCVSVWRNIFSRFTFRHSEIFHEITREYDLFFYTFVMQTNTIFFVSS